VDKDCELLEMERIMDYSLLVGIHFKDRCKDKLNDTCFSHAWSCKKVVDIFDDRKLKNLFDCYRQQQW
jgi:hypothetical protein